MFKVTMFFSSLLPMYICLLIKYASLAKPVAFFVSILLVVLGVLASLYVYFYTHSKKRGSITYVKKVTPVRQISANYLMAYVLPFIVFDFEKTNDIAIFLIVYAMLMLLYVKYNLTYFNLVLELMGFIVCNATIDGQEQCFVVLQNKKYTKYDSLCLEKIGSGLYFHIKS